MYSYTYDENTGGLLLNSTPTNFSKEPRPVYAPELDILGFDRYWKYDKQSDVPYMWAEASQYWYRGKAVAKIKGGSLFTAPEIILPTDESGNILLPEPADTPLKPIDIEEMIKKNREIMESIEEATVKKIVAIYEKYKNKLDVFHVAFSGGKDSSVLLDLVRRALPQKSYVVIFGDTGMEFPDTYDLVEKTRQFCDTENIPFYTAKSHFDPADSWKKFGPPARVLRWCCSVHKSTPQTLKLREITCKNDYVGLDFVGVRKYESTTRSEYQYENFGSKQKGQYSFNAILEWTSAEVWLYLFEKSLPINETYKKGNSRAGCLFCPMGGGKGDYFQYASYSSEINPFLELIKSMNCRDAGDEKKLQSYLENGGWNARKNGRDLTIRTTHYQDKIKNDKLILTVSEPSTDWREWIKTLGNIPFEFEIQNTKNGYQVILNSSVAKKYPKELRYFKRVFHKAACCVGCRVCETNCRNGCISFNHGLTITNCQHCCQCHECDNGCLVYHSLRTPKGEDSMKKGSLNSFANHAPKFEWIRDFFELGDSYWDDCILGPRQIPMFQRFLRETGLIDKENKTTYLFDLAKSPQVGWDSNTTWGLLVSNLAYNTQFRWYIENFEIGVFYDRDFVSELLIAEDVKKEDATSIINAYKRFCELPIGTTLNWGSVLETGKRIDSLCRSKSIISDNRIVLYSLIKFVENCNDFKEFTLSWLMNDSIERDGISPTRIFGLDYEETKSILMGLSAQYPDFIDATFTNDLDKITIKDKTSTDVLKLIGGQ